MTPFIKYSHKISEVKQKNCDQNGRKLEKKGNSL